VTGYQVRISRRQTLTWLFGAIAASSLPRTTFSAEPAIVVPGYGQDPKLIDYAAPWPRLLTASELTQLAILADLIVPGGPEAPAPSTLGVPDFLDEWVSAPYPKQVEDRAVLRTGLDYLNAESMSRAGLSWNAASEHVRTLILTDIAALPENGVIKEFRTFFCRVRQLVISAYYTTVPGMRAVGYVGNVALPAYPGVTGKLELELLDRIKRLGL
jgi:hypothetical protein